jgi:hypothetical protein
MKKLFTTLRLAALVGLALAASIGISRAQFSQGETYTNNFDIGANTTNFSGSGSVASWIYWYNTPGGNLGMTNDISLDQQGLSTSGSLTYWFPWATANNTQNLIFGTFDNAYGYDRSVNADLTSYSNISFWIRADPSTAPRSLQGTNLDYGTIQVGLWYSPDPSGDINSFETLSGVTIPLSASNAWVQLNVPIPVATANLNKIAGFGFNVQSYGGNTAQGGTNYGYPAGQVSVFYIDSIRVVSGVKPPNPTLSAPVKPISGFNAIATTPGSGGQYNREQLVTAADTGYTFVGQPSATYSWNIKSMPTGTGGNFQQHFFICGPGAPGPYDQAIDYNFANVFWVTVQQSDAGVANMTFRLKTNEPGGNGMLFNTTSPTDTVNNPNGWPVEPIATLADANGAQGNWTVNVSGGTSITVTSPTGLTTNFSITSAQSALFADPVTAVLGGQPNNPNGAGKAVVYSSFSASGVGTPVTDNFLTDTSFNTNIWITTVASDTNGVVLVPGDAAYWVAWTLPAGGFALQSKANLNTVGGWTLPSGLKIQDNGQDQQLVLNSQLPSPGQGYFQLIQFHASTLQVLFDGQTNAPNTTLGYTGSPTPITGADEAGAIANVTVNAVDTTFNIDNGIDDVVQVTTSAGAGSIDPAPTALANGTVTVQEVFQVTGNYTAMAVDNTNPNPPNATGLTQGVSATISVGP